ncbi:MAG TPA: aminotransferase class V-fold PLP-dependent enzyme [Bryobacterales bacterium]|nr:aminotransferase class V-fold PLP-dependent enzyme [Bryobacterales bacterium]
MSIREKYDLEPLINATGFPTIVGANVAPPEVIEAVSEVLAVNVEIDELQKRACAVIAETTGAEAGCVTSSCSSAIAIGVAAAMTGADLARVMQLPDTSGLANEVILQKAHDVNFGAQISQMVRLSGARVVEIGTANHCDQFYLSSAITPRTAAILYVVSGAVNPEAHLLSLEQCVEQGERRGIPVIVDAAAQLDVRPFVRAGADLVVASGHKVLGASTSGLICGRKALVRACYLQNWGIGRAMKVGKEGIVGLMAALEVWSRRDAQAECQRLAGLADLFAARLDRPPALHLEKGPAPHRVALRVDHGLAGLTAQALANLLREGRPAIWAQDAVDAAGSGTLTLDLRRLNAEEAGVVCDRVLEIVEGPPERKRPAEDVPYHDLYRSRERLLRWPD